jgi:SPP1 gp7 family putative phage head morphogenesis protein
MAAILKEIINTNLTSINMATKQHARKGRTYIPISTDLKINPVRMSSQDIGMWKKAIDQAKNPLFPKRRTLYELFDNIVLDGHLTSVMRKRVINISNKRIDFVFDKLNEKNSAFMAEYVTETPWFNKLLEYAMEQVAWGHSLVEFIPGKDGYIDHVELLNRANVVPETGMLLYNYNNINQGIKYRDDPEHYNYVIEIGGPKDYGLLMVAAQYVIYKRGGFGDWAQFAELFGMPFRTGEYDPFDVESKGTLDKALSEMGGAGYAIIPRGTEIKFHSNNSGTQSTIFESLVKECNSEISKIFLGQTMTTDNGSSKSQSETHKEVEDEIALSDMMRIEYLLNWELKEKLGALGYPVTGGRFLFRETSTLSLDKRIKIDIDVAKQTGVNIDPEYWYTTYGLPKGKEHKKTKEETKPENISIVKHWLDMTLSNVVFNDAGPDTSHFEDIMLDFALAIYNGAQNPEDIDPALWTATVNTLIQAIAEGTTDTLTEQQQVLANKLIESVAIFSGFKTVQMTKEAHRLLVDDNGNVRNFNDFKEDILKLNQTYNVNYLRAEYNHAIASAQSALKWLQFQENKDANPNLKYVTVGDQRVREEHEKLDGTIKPKDDEFWNSYLPPNGWGCRCDVIETSDEPTNHTSIQVFNSHTAEMFKNNPGKTGKLFTNMHPYFLANKNLSASIIKQVKKLVKDGKS